MQIKWQFKYYICWDLQSGVLIGDSEWRAEWLWKKKHNADVGGYYYYQAESGRLHVGEGFEVLGDGGIGRVGLAEETDVEMENISGEGGGAIELEEKEEKKGRGCRKKISRVPFNGIGAWDCD